MEYDIFAIQHELSNILTEKRFYHTLGVQTISFALAIQYGCNKEKAVLAGLLHDCAKCLDDETLILECEKYNLDISEAERRIPYLLHSKLGAYYAEHKYGVTDEEVLSAMVFHTTGKPDMTLLEKIIFTSDFIEPSRSEKIIPNLSRIRKLAFTDLNQAVYEILNNTLIYLKEQNQEIDNLTIDAYNYYKQIVIDL